MSPKIRSDHPEECLRVCVCERERALKMAEGQGDIGAITLMKTNEGYSWRERRKERKGHRERDKKRRENGCVCVCVCV